MKVGAASSGGVQDAARDGLDGVLFHLVGCASEAWGAGDNAEERVRLLQSGGGCCCAVLLLLLFTLLSGSTGTVRSVAILLVFLAGFGGALCPWWLSSSPRLLARGNSLSAGVMLSAGLIHLAGDASRELAPEPTCGSGGGAAHQPVPEYPVAMLLCSTGFVLTLVAEGLSRHWSSQGGGSGPGSRLLLTTALSFHSVLEGIALGVVEEEGTLISILVTILAHKSLAAFALGSSLLNGGTTPGVFLAVAFGFASASPLGALLSAAGVDAVGEAARSWMVPAAIGLSGGTFLFVGVVELLARNILQHEDDEDLPTKLGLFLAGWAAMALLALWT